MPGVNPASGDYPKSKVARFSPTNRPVRGERDVMSAASDTTSPYDGSSPLHRVQTPYLGFEFLSGLLDSSSFIWRLDCAEPHGLPRNLVNVPARRVRGFGLLGHARSIGRAAETALPICRCEPPTLNVRRSVACLPDHAGQQLVSQNPKGPMPAATLHGQPEPPAHDPPTKPCTS